MTKKQPAKKPAASVRLIPAVMVTVAAVLGLKAVAMAEGVLQFNLYKNPRISQPYHWTLNVIQNGQVIATSENYVKKADAKHSMDLVHAHAGDTKFLDHTGE